VLALAAYLAVFLALGAAQSALGAPFWAFLLRSVTLFLACVVGLLVYVRLGRADSN
jgi:hypothetical protein